MPDEVETTVEVGEVVGIDRPSRLLVAAVRVVTDPHGAAVEEGSLEHRDELGDRQLQLGPERAYPDRLAHAAQQIERVLAENVSDLLEGGAHRWAEDAGTKRREQVAAHDERGDLGQGQLQRQVGQKPWGESPESPVAVGGLLVVEREPRVLQHAEIPPDSAAVATKLVGRVVDSDAGWALDEL